MTIRLRSHHFLCMLTFAGKGYTPAFIINFEQIIGRISAGAEEIEVVEGPDDICTSLTSDPDCHCRKPSVMLRDHHAAEALSNLLGQPIQPGVRIRMTGDHLRVMREEFAAGTIREACVGCQWATMCDVIAQNKFERTQLGPAAML